MITLAAVLVAGLTRQVPAAPATPVVPPPEHQIAAAVLAAPEDRRMGATVLGYDATGAVVTLRAGVNDIVCLADDPKETAFSVACYHKDLEPFMARGRDLVAKGVKGKEREETRWKEIESGAIKMSREPRPSTCSAEADSTRSPARSPTPTSVG